MSPPPLDVALQVDSVSVRYGARCALDEVSLAVRPGMVTALIGPNGAGKSTLLHVLADVRQPDGGTVTCCCADRRVAYVLQRSALPDTMPLTVRQAVSMGRWDRTGLLRRLNRVDRDAIDAAMERLGITALARRQVGELSGGQRQRVLVAQGIAQRADVLLLDEPVTGLDVAAREKILDVMHDEARRGAAVVHTTHDLADAGRADHVVLLSQGRVAAAGTPNDIVQPDVVARAFGLVLDDR